MIADKKARFRQWLESGEARLLPLTLPQRELWENSPVAVSDPANHICGFIEITGPLTFDQCRDAHERVVARHEALRTSFLPGKERPLQMVRTSGTGRLKYRDFSGLEGMDLEAAMQEAFAVPFDLMQGALHHVEMIRRSDHHHLLAFSFHHAIADGWSLGVFVQDLCSAYLLGMRGLPSAPHGGLAAVPQTYSEWGAADRASWPPAQVAAKLPFWTSLLTGARPVFPPLENSPVESGPLSRHVSAVPPDLTREVREFSRRSDATLFSTLLSLFQATLAEWTGQGDILTGSPVANRTRESSRQTIGYYAGVVPIRSEVDRAQTFAARAREVHATAVDCFANALPFAELAAALGPRDPRQRHTLFDVRFALQNHPVPDVNFPGIATRVHMRSTGTARFDLACEITEDGAELEVVWLFRPRLLSFGSPQSLHSLFLAVLASAAHDPDRTLTSFSS